MYPSTILGREKAIVVNLEALRCIITADEVLLLNTESPAVQQVTRSHAVPPSLHTPPCPSLPSPLSFLLLPRLPSLSLFSPFVSPRPTLLSVVRNMAIPLFPCTSVGLIVRLPALFSSATAGILLPLRLLYIVVLSRVDMPEGLA